MRIDKNNILHEKKDELILMQKRYIQILEEQNELLIKKNKELQEQQWEYFLDRYKDIDLMFKAFLIQSKRLLDKRLNKKLKRYDDYHALLKANDKLKKYKLSELVMSVPIDFEKRIPASEKLRLMQQNYSRTYKKRFRKEAGKYLPIILSFIDD